MKRHSNLLICVLFALPLAAQVDRASIGGTVTDAAGSSGSFGRITSILNTSATGTGTPRRIQFMLRVDF